MARHEMSERTKEFLRRASLEIERRAGEDLQAARVSAELESITGYEVRGSGIPVDQRPPDQSAFMTPDQIEELYGHLMITARHEKRLRAEPVPFDLLPGKVEIQIPWTTETSRPVEVEGGRAWPGWRTARRKLRTWLRWAPRASGDE